MQTNTGNHKSNGKSNAAGKGASKAGKDAPKTDPVVKAKLEKLAGAPTTSLESLKTGGGVLPALDGDASAVPAKRKVVRGPPAFRTDKMAMRVLASSDVEVVLSLAQTEGKYDRGRFLDLESYLRGADFGAKADLVRIFADHTFPSSGHRGLASPKMGDVRVYNPMNIGEDSEEAAFIRLNVDPMACGPTDALSAIYISSTDPKYATALQSLASGGDVIVIVRNPGARKVKTPHKVEV